MTHRPCHQCRTLNSTGHRACARCGAPFVTQTIVYSADPDAPYRVEFAGRAAAAPTDLNHIGRAATLTVASVAAELALGYMERRFLRGQPVASPHARRLRNGALTTLTGAALVVAQQAWAVYVGAPH